MRYLVSIIIILIIHGCLSNRSEQRSEEIHNALPKTDSTSQNNHIIPEDKDTLSYNYKEVKKISEYFSGTKEDIDTSYYRISYPVFARRDVNKLAQDAIFIEGEADPHQAAQAFIDGYNEFVEEESTRHISAWMKDIQSHIQLNTPLLLSICTRFYEYAGGAHGHTVVIWNNFDIQRMQKIQLTDIIQEDKLPTLTQIAEKQFRTVENLTDTASLDKDFFFMNGIFALNDNFGLTAKELIFYYNEYEIKPYAKGSTMLKIPYSEIADILSTRGKEYIDSIKKQTTTHIDNTADAGF